MGKHKNSRQEKVLLKIMEDHLDLAKGFVEGDKSITEDLWINLTRLLNSEGPPIKDVSGWKKVWLDWKLNIRKKLADNKKEIKATGGGPNNSQHISAIEDTIAKITGIYSVVEGIPGTSAFGKNISENKTDEPENTNRDSTFDSSTSPSHTVKPPKPLRTNVGRADNHLNHYMDIQEVTLKGIAEKLSDSVELGKENKSSLKRIYRPLEKMNGTLNLQVEESKRHNMAIEQLKKEKNEIKKRRLEIEEMRLNIQTDYPKQY